MSAQTITINGRPIVLPERAPAPRRKLCKFCVRRELAATACNYTNGLGKVCGAGICARHSLHLGPDANGKEQVRCPHHNPNHGVYQEDAA